MTKIAIELSKEEDTQLKHLIIEKAVPSKAKYIESIIRQHLNSQKTGVKKIYINNGGTIPLFDKEDVK